MKIEAMITRDIRKLYMNSVVNGVKLKRLESWGNNYPEYNIYYANGKNFALRSVIYAMNVLYPTTWYSMVLDYQTAVLKILERVDIDKGTRAFYNGMFTGLLNIQDIYDEYDII